MTVYEELEQTFIQLLSGFSYLIAAMDEFLIAVGFSFLDIIVLVVIAQVIIKFVIPIVMTPTSKKEEASNEE